MKVVTFIFVFSDICKLCQFPFTFSYNSLTNQNYLKSTQIFLYTNLRTTRWIDGIGSGKTE